MESTAKYKVGFAVYWNTGEACGGIEVVDLNNIWTNENPRGWTYQNIGGPHDNFQGVYDTTEEANEILAALEA